MVKNCEEKRIRERDGKNTKMRKGYKVEENRNCLRRKENGKV